MRRTAPSPYRQHEAESYDCDRAREPHWQREHDYVRELLTRRAPKRMLDAPIGTGRFLPLCASERQLAGVDLSSPMLHVAKERAAELQLDKLVLVRGSIASLPFPSRSFDLTLCCRFMHLIPNGQLAAMFSELARVTAGRVCVQAYARGPLRWRLSSRLQRISQRLVTREQSVAEPWSHITAYFHPEATLLEAASRAGLRLVTKTEIDRYYSSHVMMYEWDSAT